jgi:HlyD family secretion protein
MNRMRKSLLVAALLTGTVAVGASAYYGSGGSDAPRLTTAAVSRGPIAETVAGTGTLQAVTTVQVGTQVSGTILWLGADFNSIVHKGEVIARLDPALLQTQVDQARANLTKSTAGVQSAQVQLLDAQQKYTRASDLAAKQLLAQSDLDVAKIAVDTAQAALRSAQAQVVQSKAGVSQAELDLAHTVIQAPIDGIVVARSVDVGQTVAASLSSPTVFSIAADLTKMQVSASIDESDIGQIRPQQRVTFHVDAYPTEQFAGTVTQVRLQPTVVQNVTTYSVIVEVPNPGLKLKPGMTATVSLEVASRPDAVRIPNAALRFRPTPELFAALGQTPPDSVTATLRPAAAARPAVGTASPAASLVGTSNATTADALFAPLRQPATDGRVWVLADNRLEAVPVTVGLTDGKMSELLEGDLPPNAAIVTNVAATTVATKATVAAQGSPFSPAGGGFRGGR